MSDKLDDSTKHSLVMLSPRVHLRLGPHGTIVLVTVIVATIVAIFAAAVWLAPYGRFQGLIDPATARWIAAGAFALGLINTLWLFTRRSQED